MKTILGHIPKLPRGYWDNPTYYTVLSEDGLQSHAVLVPTENKDWYWIHPILGTVETSDQKEIEEVADADLKAVYRLKAVPFGAPLDAKFVAIETEIAKDTEAPSIPKQVVTSEDIKAADGANASVSIEGGDTVQKG